jgi:hypothetical protein
LPLPSAPGVGTGFANELVLPVALDSGSGVSSSGGYVFRYVAERLCPFVGPYVAGTNECRQATGAGSNTPGGSFLPLISPGGTIYVRVTWRVDGPKNATSYFQAMVL